MFENEFDAVFSNAVLHWIKDDPDAPVAGASAHSELGEGSWASWAAMPASERLLSRWSQRLSAEG